MKYVVRVSVYQIGGKYAGLTFYNTTQKEVVAFIQRVIDEQHFSQFTKRKVTAIEVRKSVGAKYFGKTIYFSFKGLNPIEGRALLRKHMSAKQSVPPKSKA